MALHVVQLRGPKGRTVGAVDGQFLWLLTEYDSVYALALQAIAKSTAIATLLKSGQTATQLRYADVYEGRSEWKLLPSFDHPDEPARCLVSGTGLTHKASVDTRQAMHAAAEQETDSMRMYRWGLEGGRPAPEQIGTPPEWFYKGTGTILRGHGEPLDVPAYAEDGGEEPEIAGVYVIAGDGTPYRVGMTVANEFSDHVHERRNYLYLAPSKLRNCAIGPELIVEPEFSHVTGKVSIERKGVSLWEKAIASGEERMCHSLANLEHHHFKHPQHRRSGDAHVHFFGADAFSFGAGIRLEDGDVMTVHFEGFGRPLRNPVRVAREPAELVRVSTL